ncbi:E3 ubiquitin-protein ligase UPL4 isoform X2 [Daucus carota subsp. sativus]|uniref:E3 ubiquitin-protein ligase UPL4 isoform X2 n=1 Tax=Daucus carota subsp. sativus TaxID=79200 RepID=UPI0007EF116A|nr:PREDICTED: E3 ubiquitin-protein ligase UPL4 isoform X2 [Daucus carota subsp. sativus]
MGNRGQKRAETDEELPADKRPCSSLDNRASTSGTSAQIPVISTNLLQEGDMDTSSSNSDSHHSDEEKDSAYGSCDSDEMADIDQRQEMYRGYQHRRTSDDHSRLKAVLLSLSNEVEESALLAALTELCELLPFCTEDSLSSLLVQSLSPIIVKLSKHESNPDVLLLSIRAMTYLCDVHTRACSYLVKYDAVPAICQRLLNIEYLDVAEQCLQALEKISREKPLPCLQAGAILAVLKYIDFFSTSVQRVALNTAVNICKELPADCPPSLMEAVPLLCNLLQYEDRQLVENVAICLIKIAKQVCHSSEKLDELCKHGLIHQATHLIDLSSQTTLSPSVQSGLIGILVKLASGSVSAVRTLFELNISNILKDILSAYGRSHGTPSLIMVDSTCEVHEVFKLINELLPSVSQDQESDINRDKKIFLLNQPDHLERFSMDLLPVLIQVVNSGGNVYGCFCCLSVVNKLVYISNSDMLLKLLQSSNISSFLAGVFTRKDHHVLMLALQIVENILQKHSDVLLSSFVKEGVLFAVDTLVAPNRGSQYLFQMFNGIQLSSDQHQKSAAKNEPNCLCYAFETTLSSSTSEARTCKLEKDSVYNLAERIRKIYFATELSNSKERTSDIFQDLKAISASLTDMVNLSVSSGASALKEADFDDILRKIMSQLSGREPISTFEFLGSGIIKSLLGYLSVGHCIRGKPDKNGGSSCDIYTVEKRFEVLGRLLFPSSDMVLDPYLTELIHKLQSALSSVENLPVMLNHGSKQRKQYACVPYGRYISHPCMKVQFVRGEGELNLDDYSGQVLTVDPFASLDAIEGYLWRKVTGKRTKGTSPATSPSASGSPQRGSSEYTDSESMSQDLQDMQESGEQKQHVCFVQEDSNLISVCPESCNCGDASSNLIFYLNEQHLDHTLTLYQAILQHHTKAEQENITSASLWSRTYELTYRRVLKCKQGCSGLQHQQAPCSQALEKNLAYPKYTSFFSDMFVSDLASDIEKSTPAYDILLLLKVLESMNRFRFHLISRERVCSFAEGRIHKLDDLKVSVAYVTQNEFVNCRLTEKLEQQMWDPLSVSIGSMPAWCSQLMSSCPFLFSFEVRCRYFQLAAFGQRQHQPHLSSNNAGGSNSRQHHISGLPRKKFLVHRDQILESATRMMNLHASQKVVLEAEFEDEVGTGLGPTLEFYTLVSYEFQKSGLGMWRGDNMSFKASKSFQAEDASGLSTLFGLFPRPWSSQESNGVEFTEVIKKYTLLGQVVARALQDGRILDLPLSKAFYKLILGQDLTLYDIQSFDPGLGTTLVEFQAIVERNKYMKYVSGNISTCGTESCFRNTRIEDICLDFSIPGYPDFVTSVSNSKMVNMNNLEEYVSLLVDATIHSGISRQVEAFKLGFNQVFPVKNLQILTEEELEHLLCGECEVWNMNELLDHIKFDHGYTASSPPVVNMLSIIREFDRQQQKAFLRFVTGAPRLPHGGLASLNPKLTIVRKHCSGSADNDLPSAMTCANFLKLPPYSSKEKMKEKLMYAITEGQGSFDLS